MLLRVLAIRAASTAELEARRARARAASRGARRRAGRVPAGVGIARRRNDGHRPGMERHAMTTTSALRRQLDGQIVTRGARREAEAVGDGSLAAAPRRPSGSRSASRVRRRSRRRSCPAASATITALVADSPTRRRRRSGCVRIGATPPTMLSDLPRRQRPGTAGARGRAARRGGWSRRFSTPVARVQHRRARRAGGERGDRAARASPLSQRTDGIGR